MAVAAASYSPAPAASRTGPRQRPVQPKQTGYDQQEHPYAFEYSVSDPYSGANFAQQEAGDGHSTQGRYSVALPDGRIQHVNYVADHYNGFNAEVTYEGEAQYPKDRPGQGYGAGAATNTAAGYSTAPSYNSVSSGGRPASSHSGASGYNAAPSFNAAPSYSAAPSHNAASSYNTAPSINAASSYNAAPSINAAPSYGSRPLNGPVSYNGASDFNAAVSGAGIVNAAHSLGNVGDAVSSYTSYA
ncbi:cuticle protein 7-like [Amphibalanus amphitrite]|uniref:cuticle protein 7-like n=1 Tax=Amphibalanus amphitrite TaxID=1232801 RepID=UPI001C92165C|nr:cuticle protein 7-like [Amphibalanus amphitrite]